MVDLQFDCFTTIANDAAIWHCTAVIYATVADRDDNNLRRWVREAAVGQADVRRRRQDPLKDRLVVHILHAVKQSDAKHCPGYFDLAVVEATEDRWCECAFRRLGKPINGTVPSEFLPGNRDLHVFRKTKLDLDVGARAQFGAPQPVGWGNDDVFRRQHFVVAMLLRSAFEVHRVIHAANAVLRQHHALVAHPDLLVVITTADIEQIFAGIV